MKRIFVALLILLAVSPANAAIRLGHGINFNPLAPLWYKDQLVAGSYTSRGVDFMQRVAYMTKGLNGEILCFAGGAIGPTDADGLVTMLRISYDGGHSWTAPQELIVFSVGEVPIMGGPSELPDSDGTIYLPFSRSTNWNSMTEQGDWKAWYIKSNGSDYTSWSAPTEVTTQLVKITDNTTPADLPANMKVTNSKWVQCYPSPHRSVTLRSGANAGRHIWPMYYRYVGGGVSNVAFWCREPSGTWKILSGMGETAGGPNENANEVACAIDANDDIRLNMRVKNVNARYISQSTDDGATWSNKLLCDGNNGTTNLPGNEGQASLCSNPSNLNEMYFLMPVDGGATPIRANLTCFKSTDGGATYGTPTIIYPGRAAYSTIISPTAGNLVFAFEGTNNYVTYAHEWQMLKCGTAAVTDIDGVGNPIHCKYSERTTGAMDAGFSVVDQGGGDLRGQGQTAWTYNANGVVADGSNSIILDPTRANSTFDNAYSARIGDFTAEVVGHIVVDGTQNGLFATSTTAGGTGWAIYINASNQPVFSIFDGTGGADTITGTAALTTGDYAIAAKRDAGVDIQLYVNGVSAATAVTDTQVTTNFGSGADCRVGAFAGNGTPMPVATEIWHTRFWRKLVATADLLTTSTTRTSMANYCGYNPTLPSTSPLLDSRCKLWLGGLQMGGLYCTTDQTGFGPRVMPPKVGTAYSGFFDPISRKIFPPAGSGVASLYRTILTDTESSIGTYFKVENFGRPTDSVLDFIHQTAKYTIVFAGIKFHASAGATNRYLIDNGGFIGAQSGTVVRLLTTGKMSMFTGTLASIRVGGNINFSPSTNGTVRYFMAFTANGQGSTHKVLYGTYSNGLAPTSLTTVNGDDAVAQADNANASGSALMFGAETVADLATTYPNWSIKDIIIYNAELSESELLGVAAFSTFEPGTVRGSGIGIRIGTGL